MLSVVLAVRDAEDEDGGTDFLLHDTENMADSKRTSANDLSSFIFPPITNGSIGDHKNGKAVTSASYSPACNFVPGAR